MHELSIAQSILDTVISEAVKRELKQVNIIGLRIGAMTDIVPEALEFGFNALKADTILSNTSLKIETVPIKGYCEKCSERFEVNEFIFVCPQCYSNKIKTEQGSELDIAYLEVED